MTIKHLSFAVLNLVLVAPPALAANIIRADAPIVLRVADNPPSEEVPPTEEPPLNHKIRSCLDLKKDKPESPSGTYSINVGDREISAYCDMVSDGGGWTLIVAQFESDPVIDWGEGIQSDYDPSLQTRKGFALNSSEIPAHSQIGFGRNLAATDSDYVDGLYSTGDVFLTNLVGHKSGRSFTLHRNKGYFYNYHYVSSGAYYSMPEWNNTLTFDQNDTPLNWAFAPNNPSQAARGYSYKALIYQTVESHPWTVWVR